MWDGFAAVDQAYAKIISETPEHVAALVLNTGPANVRLRCWDDPCPGQARASIDMELRPGDMRAASGRLIRVALSPTTQPEYAAVGWRFLGFAGITPIARAVNWAP
jgi:hypothetical protein